MIRFANYISPRFKPEVEEYLLTYFSQQQIDAWYTALARPPAPTIVRALTSNTTPEALITALQEALPTWNVSAPLPSIPEAILISKPPSSDPQDDPSDPPEFTAELVVDLRCGEAVLRGAHVFARGVVAASSTWALGDTVAITVDLEGVLKQGRGRSDLDAASKRLLVAVGTVAMTRKELFQAASGLAVEITWSPTPAPPLNGLLEHAMFPQNLPSLLAGSLLNPPQDAVVLDMCSAPGGKSSHIAGKIAPTGVLIANELARNKLTSMQARMLSMDMKNIHLISTDGRSLLDPADVDASPPVPTSARPMELPQTPAVIHSSQDELREALSAIGLGHIVQPVRSADAPPPTKRKKGDRALHFMPKSFDAVILDPPCSGLGLRPRLMPDAELSMLKTAPAVQKELLDTAVQLLKPGGNILYSTCTLNPAENEAVIASALLKWKHVGLSLVPISIPELDPYLSRGIPGALTGLTESEAAGLVRFYPTTMVDHPLMDTPAFFMALLTKTS